MLKFFILLLLTGCKLLPSDEERSATAEPVAAEEGESQVDDKAATSPKRNDEVDLKMSKLIARIDELENEVRTQKERQKVLEKGLVTGLVPEELGSPKNKELEGPQEMEAKSTAAVEENETETPSIDFQFVEKLVVSKKFAEASKTLEGFHPETASKADQALYAYWMGVCLYYQGKHLEASQFFDQYLEQQDEKSLMPNALYYSAKVNKEMGFGEKGLDLFKQVIDQYPDHEVSKMAKWEISQLENSL
jgi:TolA-binding protein